MAVESMFEDSSVQYQHHTFAAFAAASAKFDVLSEVLTVLEPEDHEDTI